MYDLKIKRFLIYDINIKLFLQRRNEREEIRRRLAMGAEEFCSNNEKTNWRPTVEQRLNNGKLKSSNIIYTLFKFIFLQVFELKAPRKSFRILKVTVRIRRHVPNYPQNPNHRNKYSIRKHLINPPHIPTTEDHYL